jgi:hypothetical protein
LSFTWYDAAVLSQRIRQDAQIEAAAELSGWDVSATEE